MFGIFNLKAVAGRHHFSIPLVAAVSLILICGISFLASAEGSVRPGWFQIQFVDEDTGRGVPMVELWSIDGRRYVSDSAGRVAIGDPGLMNKKVFFHLFTHGYELPELEGYQGVRGIEADVAPGGKMVVSIKRINVAERVYRLTGTGIYRDSVILGEEVPIERPLINSMVIGQDTGTVTLYRGKIYWAFGDTGQLGYPLGNFQWTVATSDLPSNGGLDPSVGVNLRYIEDQNGFTKKMCPFGVEGGNLVWATSSFVVTDENGGERMVVYYTTLDGAYKIYERGLAMYNDEKQVFEKIHIFSLEEEEWRLPGGTPIMIRHHADGKDWFLITGGYYPGMRRVPADLESLKNPDAYEAWSCLEDGSGSGAWEAKLLRDENGKLVYRWTKNAPPVGPQQELAYIKAGLMDESEAYFLPVDVETGKRIDRLANGSIAWNEWRGKWIMIGGQIGGSTSFLGEIWYSEADSPTGPWKKARKIVTHEVYSMYNPTQISVLDQEGGRIIYLKGAFGTGFTNIKNGTPLYNYNMMMYRLDLSDPRLQAVWE